MNRKKFKPTRFCDLPDEVLEHICSFLLITDLDRVGYVSKRCSERNLSTMSLSLDESSDSSTISTCKERKQLLRSMGRFLIRRGFRKLQCFRFSWHYHDHDQGKPESCCPKNLNRWIVMFIDNVVKCNVEDLHLMINRDITKTKSYVEFPVVRCESLRNLYVKGMNTDIKTLSSSSFSNLERLELTLVKIEDEGIFKWISDSCRCIKELRLEDVYGLGNKSASISSSSLKSFTFILNKNYSTCNYNLNVKCENLEDACIHLGVPLIRGKYDGALYFSSPNLKNLKWSGHWMKFQNSSKVVSLEKAELDLHSGINHFNDVPNLFRIIQGAKVLDIMEGTIKCLYKGDLEPEQLHRVCCLRIRGLSLMDEDVPAMVSLLKRMQNLTTLHIEAGRNTNRYKSGYYRSSDKLDLEWGKLAVQNLREVTIQLSVGHNGINFTRYVIHNALKLQKISVYYLQEQAYVFKKFKLPKTSNAEVVFRVREDQYQSVETEFGFLDEDVDPLGQTLIQKHDSIAKGFIEDSKKYALSYAKRYWMEVLEAFWD